MYFNEYETGQSDDETLETMSHTVHKFRIYTFG